ncbi:4'-phosphopantetheinyl transferase family protein [Streptomyces litmocidini]|uniref:4'-phosphopantetheinyl transferase family protein n=1 Tax=Streptomyces litmocidini TaxID=67318 RepID=UPI003702358E
MTKQSARRPRAVHRAGRPTAMRPPGASLAIPAGELDVWSLRPPHTEDGPVTMATGELDENERRRADAFLRPSDRLQYVAAHIALRRLLAAYTGVAPERVRLGGDPACDHGGRRARPAMLDAPIPLHFSLSHSHGLVLFGVAATPVGVDVQRVPSPVTAGLCLPRLHPAEQEELARLPDEERPSAFGRLWTRKEAYLKGLGTGLGRSPAADYLGERRGAAAPVRPSGWIVRNLPTAPGHVAAAAVLAEADHRATVRTLPAECLYVKDAAGAVELFAAAETAAATQEVIEMATEREVGTPC